MNLSEAALRVFQWDEKDAAKALGVSQKRDLELARRSRPNASGRLGGADLQAGVAAAEAIRGGNRDIARVAAADDVLAVQMPTPEAAACR